MLPSGEAEIGSCLIPKLYYDKVTLNFFLNQGEPGIPLNGGRGLPGQKGEPGNPVSSN